jgi:hypothetical protein
MNVPKPPTSFNEGKISEEITEKQQTKAVIVLSMLGEMGISDKTYDDVIASLIANHWDENEALGTFF